ncbi:hypothetical protein ACP70R_046496 [Stipagrostis hirtigluma subsp. patula]
MARGKCRGRKAQAPRAPPPAASSSSSPTPPPPTPTDKEPPINALPEHDLCLILRRLAPADLLRAALACRRWRRAAARALPRAPPPLLGYLFHPAGVAGPFPLNPTDKTFHPAVFMPLDADASKRVSLALSPSEARGFSVSDVHLGLVLLLPRALPEGLLPRVLVLDPASRRRALLPAPPRAALPGGDPWRGKRMVFGVSVLSRAHPSRLSFDAVCFTVDGDRPRAWVATVRDADCTWRAMPRSEDVRVDFDPWLFEDRCVRAAGDIYWHICNSSRALKLDPRTLDFSYLPVPAELGDRFKKYRIGETPEDGRLCMAALDDDMELQIWVRGEAKWSDRGWLLERRMCINKALHAVPGLPRDRMHRMACTWLSDMDYARTGKVFIQTWGYGRYSFHMDTGKLQRLEMKDGKEHGHPIWAYTLAWPPAFLAPED